MKAISILYSKLKILSLTVDAENINKMQGIYSIIYTKLSCVATQMENMLLKDSPKVSI